MATLDRNFEDDLAESILNDVEAKMGDETDGIVGAFIEQVHDTLREWGNALDYNVDPIIESFEFDGVKRTDRGLTIRMSWNHPLGVMMEYGTPDHEIEGDPILSFVWSEDYDPPDWVKREFEREGDGWRVFLPRVEVAGIPKVRQIRDALMWFRGELRK